ncbi:sarcosine oxidase subunit delta [Roseobacter sp.]|uniref:sarcosine oxidase subunit delta n=1 Tax=Roseobacter sp. TaxID=1907202 RepID=UPI00296776A3|nr:sarcosine oxidase subunit delta [Roseobacter sp.]MDW3183861.1 sarcosine oxidase subunit delta [Roseobacter sp.]
MRLTCPICGRGIVGSSITRVRLWRRPAPDAGAEAWDEYLHLRDNPAGARRELWQHEAGCGAWLVVERNTSTHEVVQVSLVLDEAAV